MFTLFFCCGCKKKNMKLEAKSALLASGYCFFSLFTLKFFHVFFLGMVFPETENKYVNLKRK